MPSKSLHQACLVLLLKDKKILLAMKKRGFGKGFWNGTGGKLELGETALASAIRETQEEIGVTPKNLQKVADNTFYFPEETGWSIHVVVFVATEWEGEPQETEEMAPQWFDRDKVPYDQMWEDDIHWLPQVLEGRTIKGEYWFDKDQKLMRWDTVDFEFSDEK